ncbi:hypothetical protein C2857_001165 [Epichloe festucae Fl1]|uniref:AHC1-like C2H2 zinc-finger domain-containing protein n=1 Tax=Epichloe festucae (strain Fl1) TaxID=877507 RepID=A0A7S9KU57_EPIFF|nr:hypothetical protein C2857_001165 [Epichloe festucae Fl1]
MKSATSLANPLARLPGPAFLLTAITIRDPFFGTAHLFCRIPSEQHHRDSIVVATLLVVSHALNLESVLMFRFWSTESRGSDQTADLTSDSSGGYQLAGNTESVSSHSIPGRSAPKRSWDAFQNSDAASVDESLPKRTKLNLSRANGASPSDDSPASTEGDRMERARDIIRHQVGLEVLLKHEELRLINQELAKCQVALEQLRRCHLIPYPQHCPTPEQMLDISSGKGPAVIRRFGEPVPRWAPPFGVVDGPYARHYAKWLIPDASFDGEQAEWQLPAEFTRSRLSSAEGRTTRNSVTDMGSMSKGRPVRGNAGQKLQALSNGYPQPKDKAGPCILKRSDGQTVKLVCLDCNRENFSSTQGFINHCRIAHKRDFKSHEEAAVRSGQPIEAIDKSSNNNTHSGSSATAALPRGDIKANAAPTTQSNSNCTSASTLVHPFARQDMSEQEAYLALQSRIAESLKLYHQGKLPGVSVIPSKNLGTQVLGAKKTEAVAARFNHASATPYLSRLMQSRNFNGNICDAVADAKTKISLEDMTPDEESDDASSPTTALDGLDAAPIRNPVVKRVPAQSSKTPAAKKDSPSRPASNKSRAPPISLVSPPESTMGGMSKSGSAGIVSDEDDDVEEANLSPNTLASNIAPSLVSDDGEYDDSDDGSSISGGSDELDAASVSDVAEITLDDEQDARTLRRGSNIVSGTVRLRKNDAKKQHVTFLGPVKNRSRERRPHGN